MRQSLLILLAISLFLVPGNSERRSKYVKNGLVPSKTIGQVWPMPQQVVQEQTYLTVDPQTFEFVYQGIGCTIIDAAIARYQTIIFNPPRYASCFGSKLAMDPANFVAALPSIQIILTGSCETMPYSGMDESYALKIDTVDVAGAAQLTANSVWGILRGLESFSQCVYHDDARNFYANSTDITDFPRFPFRGFLMDLGRHYMSIDAIKLHLDALTYNKFNVFHWRLTDDESFPYQSQQFPSMSDKGAYNNKTHIYTFDDINSVINYARDRGIRVIPELSTPGHSQSWELGMPGLLTPCYTDGAPDGKFGPVDPTKNSTFDFLTEFYTEAARIFPESYFQLGGDEVDFTCWMNNPNVTQFMQQMGYGSDYSKLYCYYMNRLIDIVSTIPNSKNHLLWHEAVDNNCQIAAGSLIQVWNSLDELGTVTSKGHQGVLSSCYSIDYIQYGSDWVNFYNCDPYDFSGTQAQYDLVQGGTVTMWAQYVDATNFISRAWPRASAIAERLWSNRAVNDSSAAAPRLDEHRCRMVERNINAEPFNGANFCPADYLIIQ